MAWWFVPSMIGVVVAGIVVGLIVSYFLLKRRGRTFPFLYKHNLQAAGAGQIELFKRSKEPETAVESAVTDRMKDTPNKEKIEVAPVGPSAEKRNEAWLELENNFSIATGSSIDKPVPFQTEIWNNRRTEFNVFDSDLRWQITEAYIDMLLANDVVWLMTKLDRNSAEMTNSYTRLKGKIAERLQLVMPAVRKSFPNTMNN